MKAFRKIIFWLHLSAGVCAGSVVLIMSVTGLALAYEKQMTAWADLRQYRVGPPAPGAPRLPVDRLLEAARAARGELPSSVTVRPDPTAPVALAYGRETILYVDPYTGKILGEGPAGMRSFFRVMTDWHRWLGASGENRNAARSITGACNLAFLFMVLSGFYLWWPRSWRWPNVKSVVLFRGGLAGKARDFNWHNVIGFWSAIPLFCVVLSGVVISYPWASDLVYRAAGEKPPPRRGPGPGFGPGGPAGRPPAVGQGSGLPANPVAPGGTAGRPPVGQGSGLSANPAAASDAPRRGPRRQRQERAQAGGFIPPPADLNLEGLDRLLARARQQVPGWRSIGMRLPSSDEEPVSFAIDAGTGGQPHLRSTLTLSRPNAEVVSWETFSDGSRGRRLRTLLRFIHTGEAGGILGQTIAGLVSGGAAVLVYTGLALALRRFVAWVRRKRTREREHALVGVE